MSSYPQIRNHPSSAALADCQCWYAVHVRARHEKRVAAELARRAVTTFLPLVTERHQWSDRRQTVEVPLFSCYLFVSMETNVDNRQAVLRAPGVLGFVGSNHVASPVSQTEINNIRALLENAGSFSEHPFLKVGQRVRIRGGALAGLEGILVRRKGKQALVISIEAIERSLIIEIDGQDVEPL